MNNQVAQQLLQQVQQDYNAIAEHFSYTRSSQWYEVSFLIEQYITPGQLVLDLGCGNGRVADLVNEIKADYIGIDVSEGLIAQAHKLHPNNTFKVSSMLEIDEPDATFDHTVMIASFHHIPSEALRLQVLNEVKRVTKPGGYIIMTNWNLHQRRFWKLRYTFLLQKWLGKHQMDRNDVLIPWRNQKRELQANRYYHGFTMREMKELAQQTSLQIIDQYYETHGVHLPRWKGQNLVSVLQVT